MPIISVIMSVYNSENYIKDSVESILNQTFSDLEFIITDDCSTDNTLKILKEYEKKDDRIKLLVNSENIGLTKSLNKMINISNGEFIARMDADDISHAQRFEKQISFLKTNNTIGLCGTNTENFGNYVSRKNIHWAFKHEEIRATLLFFNTVPHGTVLIRKKIINTHKIRYDEHYKIIQDYELWQRLIHLTKFAIIPEVLLKYRITDTNITGISLKKANYRENLLKQIFKVSLENFGIFPNEHELAIHSFIVSNNINKNIDWLKNGEKWLKKLYKYNYKNKIYDNIIFYKLLSNYWLNLCTRSTSLGLPAAVIFFKSKLYNYNYIEIKSILRMLVKCLIKYKG